LAALKQKSRKVVALACGNCCELLREYPRDRSCRGAEAARYGLYDLDRLERMILPAWRVITSYCWSRTRFP